jgi:predicted RNA methylase
MKALSPETLAVLTDDLDVTGGVLRITRQLDRKVYLEINAALEALGGTWDKKRKGHVFAEDPRTALDDVLTDGGFYDKKRDLQQFFTPPKLAKGLVDKVEGLMKLKGKTVLEPSAGKGALAVEVVLRRPERLVCLEKDPALANSLPGFIARDLDAMDYGKSTAQLSVDCADFLAAKPPLYVARHTPYHAVVMNPPFTRGQDVDHVTHAVNLLAPGGVLGAIVSGGVTWKEDRRSKAFRALLRAHHAVTTNLPEGAFAESGTNVRTSMVLLRKP